MDMKDSLTSLGDIIAKKPQGKKPPAYQWQELALRIITELGIPNFKRNSVFKVCRDYPKEKVLRALNDTKELVQTGERWRYFFKIIDAS